MKTAPHRYLLAVLLSATLHALVLWHVGGIGPPAPLVSERTEVMAVVSIPPPPAPEPARAPARPPGPAHAPPRPPPPTAPPNSPTQAPPPLGTAHTPAFMAAPPAPTSEEWALAATYSLKNSKRYRHTWGQQVRSLMGTAFEGADQGLVRLRIEIAPNGTLVRMDTLWTTSTHAEALARVAVERMPPLPPTPTGQPLIFEKTISFQPHSEDDAPYYKDDCLPDRPGFSNPFVFDGQSGQRPAPPPAQERLDPQAAQAALEECLKQLPQDSLEGESAHDQRLLKQWRSDKLGH